MGPYMNEGERELRKALRDNPVALACESLLSQSPDCTARVSSGFVCSGRVEFSSGELTVLALFESTLALRQATLLVEGCDVLPWSGTDSIICSAPQGEISIVGIVPSPWPGTIHEAVGSCRRETNVLQAAQMLGSYLIQHL